MPVKDFRQFLHPALLILVMLLSACASGGKTQSEVTESASQAVVLPSQYMETDDLAMVTDLALSLARRLGKDRVLVVFDIDNTLLAMEQDLGSDQWYDWQKELQSKDVCDPRLVADRLAVQGALYSSSAMRLTQADGPEQVRMLQDAGLNVIALTSRGHSFRLQTFRELRRNDFSFYTSAIGQAGGYPEPFIPERGTRPALYEDGVFLTAGQHKGDMLVALLNKTGTTTPEVIVVADDKDGNLHAVLEAFAGSTTSVQAFRYSREDAVLAKFDGQQAAQQWQDIEPALLKIQQVFGPDNFEIPQNATMDECSGISD